MSDFECPVVRVGAMTKHPNADTLSIVEAEGCPVIVRTNDFKLGDLAVYLPVESVILEDREWVRRCCAHLKFKGGSHRLKAVRLRGIFSMGMLVPLMPEANGKVGQDVAGALGVTKYEEPEEAPRAQKDERPLTLFRRVKRWVFRLFRGKPAPRPFPEYHVDHYRKSKHLLHDGLDVVVTEKIHGTNFACGIVKGKFLVSSHKVIRRADDDSIYWKIAKSYGMEERLRHQRAGIVVYGEIYGEGIQDMAYDTPPALRVFDIYDTATKRYLDESEFAALVASMNMDRAPVLYSGPYLPEKIESLADGPSTMATHFREGVVIKAAVTGARGRLAQKLIGETYLLRKNGTERH